MSLYTIEINDEAIIKQIHGILNTLLEDEIYRKYSTTGHVISEAIKELVYSHKDEIIDKVVNRAVKEIVRKGMPKLLERMGDNDR